MRPNAASASSTRDFERLLADARGGCAQSLGELLQGSRRFLLLAAAQTLESTLRPKAGISDLVQEVHVCAYRDFPSFRGATEGEFAAWLRRILERRLQTHARRYRRAQRRTVQREVSLDQIPQLNTLGITDQGLSPSESASLADEVRAVRAAVERLPPIYQEILELRTWRRYTFPQIAEQLGATTGAVEKLWGRAILRLKAELTRDP